jgi:hypothetical protein
LFLEKKDVNLQNNLSATEDAEGLPAKQLKLIVGTERSGNETGGNENATGEKVNRAFQKIMGLVQMDIPRYKHEKNFSNFYLGCSDLLKFLAKTIPVESSNSRRN